MRTGYWWIAGLLGVGLVAAPFVGKFTMSAWRHTRTSSRASCSWCGRSWGTGTWAGCSDKDHIRPMPNRGMSHKEEAK